MYIISKDTRTSFYNTPSILSAVWKHHSLVQKGTSLQIPNFVKGTKALFCCIDYDTLEVCKASGIKSIFLPMSSEVGELEFMSNCDESYALSVKESERLHIPWLSLGVPFSSERLPKTSSDFVIGYTCTEPKDLLKALDLDTSFTYNLSALVDSPDTTLLRELNTLSSVDVLFVDSVTPDLLVWQALGAGVPVIAPFGCFTYIPGALLSYYKSTDSLLEALQKIRRTSILRFDLLKAMYNSKHSLKNLSATLA